LSRYYSTSLNFSAWSNISYPVAEEPQFPEITQVEAEMMWEEEKQYFNFNPFTPERIARLPHLPVEGVPRFDDDEREDRLKNWLSSSNSKADPNDRLPGMSPLHLDCGL
jgi:hypothetical protein